MSQCGVNRWGPGTTKERVADTEAAKEMKDRMALMMKEREKQNNMWLQVSDTSSSTLTQKAPSTSTSAAPSTTQIYHSTSG